MVKFLPIFFSLLFSSVLWAQIGQNDKELTIDQNSTRLDKNEVLKVIELFEQTGQISKEDAARAKQDLMQVSPEELSQIQQGMSEQAKEDSNNRPSNETKGGVTKIALPNATPIANATPALSDAEKKSQDKNKKDSALKDALQYLNAK